MQGGTIYNIIEFTNNKNKTDLAIVSDKWLSVDGRHVYCPQPSVPTLVLAKSHSTPTTLWGKCDVIKTVFTNSKLNSDTNFCIGNCEDN